MEVNWLDYSILEGDVLEFSTNLVNTLENANLIFLTKYNVIASPSYKGGWEFEIIKYVSTFNKDAYNTENSNLLEFTGTAYYYSLDGIVTKIKMFDKGEEIESLNFSQDNNSASKIQNEQELKCDHCVYLRIETWKDWYIGVVGSDGSVTYTYSHSTLENVSIERIYSPITYNNNMETVHEHFSHGAGGTSVGSAHEFELELTEEEENTLLFQDKIDDASLDPCLKNILNNLKNVNTGVGAIVTKFADSIPGYNWEVKDGDLSGGTGATDPPANYDHSTGTITTTLDSQAWKDATDLSWARTILHESIHAYLASQFAISRPNWIATYPEMVEDWGQLQNWNDVHHEEIARSIVNDISLSLQEYGNSRGYNFSSQFYDDLAWGGLHNTATFQSLDPDEKTRILNTIAIELTGTDTQSNSKPQKGTNAGC